ncbi:ribbon-helix-helix domain-containing protein [Thermococcus sp. MV11]|uniref:ribbon-helix-helix domain-containing protein n=1 Tax=Thermococcus sp. MV11 TaxID=1638267 RepID=UPI001431FC78|nr:ribbon-helix-helix domain-containing protein [Thermococcus sp. MV11]NJE03814.1 ribbon-helix-helix protein, CopG family [Thermococcus sp. MV11]
MATTVKVSARIPKGLAERMDRLIEEGFYSNRSEIIKEALRDFLLRRMSIEDSEIKGYLRAVEEILREDWESEADEYWDDVGGVPYEPKG